MVRPALSRAFALALALAAPTLPALAASFSANGGTVQVTLAAGEALALANPGGTYVLSLASGTWSGTDTAGLAGNGTSTLTLVQSNFTLLQIDDAGPGASFALNANPTLGLSFNVGINVVLDDAAAGDVTINGIVLANASFSFAGRSVTVTSGAYLTAQNGASLSLLGNQQIPSRAGEFVGVTIDNARVQVVGTGSLTLKGRGGDNSAGGRHGILISGNSQVIGGSGPTVVEGRGGNNVGDGTYGVCVSGGALTGGVNLNLTGVGGAGAGADCKGVFVATSATLSSSGSLDLTGTGGGSTTGNHGVEVALNGNLQASGNLTINATGGGNAAGSSNHGLFNSGIVTAFGASALAITATGGPGSGGTNQGVKSLRGALRSTTGNVLLTGIAGGGTSLGIDLGQASGANSRVDTGAPGSVTLTADRIQLAATTLVQASTVTVQPATAGWDLNVGSATDVAPGTLEISNAEIARITATNLNIGSSTTGLLSVSNAITVPSGETLNLFAATIRFVPPLGAITGTFTQNQNGLPYLSLEQPVNTTVANNGTVDFGTTTLADAKDVVFTIRNLGTGALSGFVLTFDGANAADFGVLTPPASSVPGGGTTTFTVRLTPGALAARSAALHVASNVVGGLNPYNVSLTATVVPNIVLEQPTGTPLADGGSLAFGSVATGSSADRTFTVRNVGLSDLTGLAVSFDGPDATQFSVLTPPAATVPPAGSTTFTVRFAPTGASGSRSAFLRLASSAPGSLNPFDVQLSGAVVVPIAGTRTIGPGGAYASLGAALADAVLNGLAGPLVFELRPGYDGAAETYPLNLSGLATSSANPLVIRPAAGASNLQLASAGSTTLNLDGVSYVTIDGRPGGVGTNSELTIANTSASGAAVRLQNGSTQNTLQYLRLRGAGTTASNGTLVFGSSTATTGNSNNTIDACELGSGATPALNAIYSSTAAPSNSSNTVSNCRIFDFSSSTADSAGVRLDAGNAAWTISGNSFYQTAPVTSGANTQRAIYLNDTTGGGYSVTGNFIGGDTAGAVATSGPWVQTATTGNFIGIHVVVAFSPDSGVHGNVIRAMQWSSANTTAPPLGTWVGIYVPSGSVEVGTASGNTIGAATGNDSITVANTTTINAVAQVAGIYVGSGAAVSNNRVGSITTRASSASGAAITGIRSSGQTVSNNLVGSLTTADSLLVASNGSSTGAPTLTGILLAATSQTMTASNNTVANLTNNNANNTINGGVRGIFASSGPNTVSGNTVRNLSALSGSAAIGAQSSVLGLAVNVASNTFVQSVTQNTVHSLANRTTTNLGVQVMGIDVTCSSSTLTAGLVARNFVHSLETGSVSALSVLSGIQMEAGTFSVQNNFVRLGLKADGTNATGAAQVRGLVDNGTTAGRHHSFNSVYVGGVSTFGTASSTAFLSASNLSNTRSLRNNILVNDRINAGGTGVHYAAFFGTSSTGLTSNWNLFRTAGPVLARFNNVDRVGLSDLQAATSQDANSLVADPLFLNPTGTAATVDLHVAFASPARAAGGTVAGITDDFDGDLRVSPPWIGADEVNGQPPSFSSAVSATFTIGTPGTFTVLASGSPTPTLSAAGALPNGVTFTPSSGLLAGTPTVGTAGSYPLLLTASNGVAPEATQNFTLFVNTPPTAQDDVLAASRNTPVAFPAARLLLNDRDADGDPLTVLSVSPASAQGGSVSLAGGTLTYAPPAGFSGADSFSYTISDGRGGLASALVQVTVSGSVGTASPNLIGLTVGSGSVQLRWQGIVGYAYLIQYTDDLGASWQNFPGTVTAGPTGGLDFVDTTQPTPSQRFYRTVIAP